MIVFILVYTFRGKPNLYGNSENTIRQKILLEEQPKGGLLEILNIIDIENNRIVSYLYNSQAAYIQFTLDSNGNYEYIQTVRYHANFGYDIIILTSPMRTTKTLLTINSKYSNIQEISIEVDNNFLTVDFEPINSVKYIELPVEDLNDFSYLLEVSKVFE